MYNLFKLDKVNVYTAWTEAWSQNAVAGSGRTPERMGAIHMVMISQTSFATGPMDPS